MEKYITIVKDDIITIQRAEYIEDGWYIEIVGDKITLFDIPYGGGDPCLIDYFDTLIEAIKETDLLN